MTKSRLSVVLALFLSLSNGSAAQETTRLRRMQGDELLNSTEAPLIVGEPGPIVDLSETPAGANLTNGTNTTDNDLGDTSAEPTAVLDESSEAPSANPSGVPAETPASGPFVYDDTTELPDVTKFGVPDTMDDDDKTLYIHVVPHTHDDVGWLKTVDQYFHGANQTIQNANVKVILDSVMEALQEKDYRTFVYVEQKFFSQWWLAFSKNDPKKGMVKDLVHSSNQLSFVNGGWSMHDEAAAHYVAMMDQTTTGHDFLRAELNVIPKVGWQLDPFGHSSSQASYFSSKVGFDALFLGRIDYQDLEKRHGNRQCEGLWNAASDGNLAGDSSIFWGLTGSYGGNYGAPSGFDFNTGVDNTDSVDDPLLQDLSVSEMLQRLDEKLLPQLQLQAQRTQGQHMMLTMGTDFRYQNAPVRFQSNDLMIQGVEAIQQANPDRITELFADLGFDSVKIFYSSPEYYTQQKYDELQKSATSVSSVGDMLHLDYDVKRDDFFPYADSDSAYWTGYFTSRPSLKRLIRQSSGIFNSVRQMEALFGKIEETANKKVKCDCDWSFFPLENALGIAQHHDAITGTSKQHVAFDYAKRLAHGIDKAMNFITNKMRVILLDENHDLVMDDLEYCQLLNETTCDVAVQQTKDADEDGKEVLSVVVYNGLAQERSKYVRLPVGAAGTYRVTRKSGDNSTDQSSASNSGEETVVNSFPVPPSKLQEGAEQVIVWNTGPLPPIGLAVFSIARIPPTEDRRERILKTDQAMITLSDANDDGKRIVSNSMFDIHFDASTGMLSSAQTSNGVHPKHEMSVLQTWGYYEPYQADTDQDPSIKNKNQNSGAYIFRPKDPSADSFVPIVPSATGATFTISSNNDMVEITNTFEDVDWVSQVVRMYADKPYVEVEYTVGPIDVSGDRGKEIVTRFHSEELAGADMCKTDSNGREFLQRKKNFRPTWDLEVSQEVAGNYYPITTAISLETDASYLALLTDRSLGGGCIADGSVELMVQRRLLRDDHRGVGEELDETTGGVTPYPPYGDAERVGDGIVIRGVHRIMFGAQSESSKMIRSNIDDIFMEPLVFAGSAPEDGQTPWKATDVSLLEESLPENVMLLTYLHRHTDTYMVRLGHQFAAGEDSELSKTAQVDLQILFSGFVIDEIIEMTLSGNQEYSKWVDRRMDWAGTGPLPPALADGTVIDLKPMDIRTFIVKVKIDGVVPTPTPTPAPHHTSTHSSAPHHSGGNGHHSSKPPHSVGNGNSKASSNDKVDKGSSFPMAIVYGAIVAAIVGGALYAYKRNRYGKFDKAAGNDLDFELQAQGYRPGMS